MVAGAKCTAAGMISSLRRSSHRQCWPSKEKSALARAARVHSSRLWYNRDFRRLALCYLHACMYVCMSTTLMDSSSEFQKLSFAPGVTVEGQFLASLAPDRTPRESKCDCKPRVMAPHVVGPTDAARPQPLSQPLLEKEHGQAWETEATQSGVSEDSQRFWHVLVSQDI
jgi:hypothetical protein